MRREAMQALLECVPGPWDAHMGFHALEWVDEFLEMVADGEEASDRLQVISTSDEVIYEAVYALLLCLPRSQREAATLLAVDTVLSFANEFRSDVGIRDVWVENVLDGYQAWADGEGV